MRWMVLFTVLISLGLLSPANAAEDIFEEGVHFKRINPAQPTSTGDKVEVLEIFWYGCPHCFRFEPTINRWLKRKPAEAEFVRLPGILRPGWEPHARAFYAAEILGVWDKIHEPLFNALHLEKKNLNSEEALADFFADFGVDKAKFSKTYRSFAVETRVRRAKNMVRRYGINGVPAVVVAGKYLVSNQMTGGPRETMEVVNHLVAKESGK